MRALVTASLRRLTDAGDEAAPLVAALHTVADTMPTRAVRPVAPVPALAHLPAALAGADATDPLAVALREIVGLARGPAGTRRPTRGPHPIDGFANGGLIGAAARWVSPSVQLGPSLYAPGMVYPPHGHGAVEAYLIVSGRATGAVDGIDRTLQPGDVVVHPGDAVHECRVAPETPLWLVWVRAGALDAPTWAPLPGGDRHHPAVVAQRDP